jgi:hypothetical protein
MISEAERNYQPKEWVTVPNLPPGCTSLNQIELYRFCNTDSQAFRDQVAMGRADRVTLLDYELINLGFEPTNGSMISKTPGGKIALTVFTAEGSKNFIEV